MVGDVIRTGEDVRRLRLEIGWDQATLATVLGISKAYMSDMERGHRALGPKLADLTVALGVPHEHRCPCGHRWSGDAAE